jgi:hypothetical protein
VRFPFLYVLAVEGIPSNRVESHREGCGCNSCAGYHEVVEEQLFCLHEGAGQIQFHRQGIFKIYATVIWYNDDQLSFHTWRTHRANISEDIENYRSRILDGLGNLYMRSLDHVEEDVVQITDTFFAKKPNPTLWWWATLWWEDKPRNSCDYKKRLWFVLWIQVITVSIYAFLRGVLMAFCYLGLLLVGFRPSAFSFRPMFHAFSSMFKQMCDFESKTCNWAMQDANGRDRKTVVAIASRIPLVWIASPILLYLWAGSIYHHPKGWIWAVIFVVCSVGNGVGLFFLLEKLKSRNKSIAVYYEQVPVERPKKRRVTPKVRWLDAKGKYCLPFPK